MKSLFKALMAGVLACVIVLGFMVCIFIWVRVGQWLIPAETSDAVWKQVAYLIASAAFLAGFIFGLGEDDK